MWQQILLCSERSQNISAKSEKCEWAVNCWTLWGWSWYWYCPFLEFFCKKKSKSFCKVTAWEIEMLWGLQHSVSICLCHNSWWMQPWDVQTGMQNMTRMADMSLFFFLSFHICSCWSRITPGVVLLRCTVRASCVMGYLKRASFSCIKNELCLA